MDRVKDLLFNPSHSRWLIPVLIVADAALCGLIVWKVPYTEIDWVAYMQQVSQFIAGERDYAQIKGDTGPLVYPGAHVYIYTLLYSVTDKGRDIRQAQIIFAVLYLLTLATVMACYRQAKAPPYLFALLILSKRVHSIFLLRLFNDCFAVFFFFLAVYFYQRRFWTVGSVFYTTALGVKMVALLVLPAIGAILVQAIGRDQAVTQALVIGQMQVLYGYTFLIKNTVNYFSRAFELSRVFLWKWTVNWRFVPEEVFLSSTFSGCLLLTHLSLLAVFGWTRWLAPLRNLPHRRSIRGVVSLLLAREADDAEHARIVKHLNPSFIMTAIFTANLIGMLCARSLHYQFYAWLYWTSPFLAFRAGFGPAFVLPLWAAQEWAWNVYPSTNISSAVVVGCLATTTIAVWWGSRGDVKAVKATHRD